MGVSAACSMSYTPMNWAAVRQEGTAETVANCGVPASPKSLQVREVLITPCPKSVGCVYSGICHCLSPILGQAFVSKANLCGLELGVAL